MILENDQQCLHEWAMHDWRPEKHAYAPFVQWRRDFEVIEKYSPQQWQPLRRDLFHIVKAVVTVRYLLELTDESDQPACSRETWDRAVQFLTGCARRAWNTAGRKIDAPAILPGPGGSIDLHWKKNTYEMLINIPANASEHPNYYGDDVDGNSTKGVVARGDNQGLISWLTTRK